MSAPVPLPPFDLRERVGILPSDTTSETAYLENGLAYRRAIENCLPAEWTWREKRVLDFGCGAGRTLRHFVEEAAEAEFWGCDIDVPSIDWCGQMLCPPMAFVINREVPPLEVPSSYFNLVYAVSVFTHITTHWAGWLLELHRVTAMNGLLVITFMGEGMSQSIAGEPWDENRVGMNVYEAGQDWALGGPMVLHSPWWIQEHWGRLFPIERLEAKNFGGGAPALGQHDHGVVVLRKTDKGADFAELERLDPAEPREATALYHDVQHLRAEVAELRAGPRTLL